MRNRSDTYPTSRFSLSIMDDGARGPVVSRALRLARTAPANAIPPPRPEVETTMAVVSGAVQVRLPSVSLPSASPHKLPLRPGPAHRPEDRPAVPITRDCRTKHAGHRDRLVWRHTQ